MIIFWIFALFAAATAFAFANIALGYGLVGSLIFAAVALLLSGGILTVIASWAFKLGLRAGRTVAVYSEFEPVTAANKVGRQDRRLLIAVIGTISLSGLAAACEAVGTPSASSIAGHLWAAVDVMLGVLAGLIGNWIRADQ